MKRFQYGNDYWIGAKRVHVYSCRVDDVFVIDVNSVDTGFVRIILIKKLVNFQ